MRKTLTYMVLFFTIILLIYEGGKVSKNTIRESAYNYLDTKSKSSITDWKSATIKIRKYNKDYLVETSNNELIDIKDKKTYQVTFKTNNEVLGPIIVYLDKDSLEVLGIDFRE